MKIPIISYTVNLISSISFTQLKSKKRKKKYEKSQSKMNESKKWENVDSNLNIQENNSKCFRLILYVLRITVYYIQQQIFYAFKLAHTQYTYTYTRELSLLDCLNIYLSKVDYKLLHHTDVCYTAQFLIPFYLIMIGLSHTFFSAFFSFFFTFFGCCYLKYI